jgi:hypothetical protein
LGNLCRGCEAPAGAKFLDLLAGDADRLLLRLGPDGQGVLEAGGTWLAERIWKVVISGFSVSEDDDTHAPFRGTVDGNSSLILCHR